MQRLAASLSMGLLAAVAGAQGIISPYSANNNPNLGTTVISADGNNQAIAAIEQIEMRHLGAGIYRTIVTADWGSLAPDASLVMGTINMTTNPPTWTADPVANLAQINVTGTATDEFAGSVSDDGLVLVWDNYQGVAAPTYPNVAATAYSFVCVRANLASAWSAANVRAVQGVAIGGVDTKLGRRLANGNYEFFFIDFIATNDIFRGELDPNTGALTNTARVVNNLGQTGFGFSHSPEPMRDTTGASRATCYSEYVNNAGQRSDGIWTPDINAGTGAPRKIADGAASTPLAWIANPSANGGTINWATAVGGYGNPSQLEATFLANADLTSGSGRVAAFAPIRPRQNSAFISVVALGAPANPPYQIPGVQGNIEVFPTVGVLDFRIHDPFLGTAEWVFLRLPRLNTSITAQLITLDNGQNIILAGNTALVFL